MEDLRKSMKLSKLTEKAGLHLVQGNMDTAIAHLTSDSRKVLADTVFVCIVGAMSDGHKYIQEVIEKGAAAIVIQRGTDYRQYLGADFTFPEQLTVLEADDTRLAYALMSAAFFDYPAENLFTIGITGTKGKTTTTYMIKNVLEHCGYKTGLIGTIETIIDGQCTPACNTTPESYQIHETFAQMAAAGCKAVVMEVSSQGLMLHRTAGIRFDIGVFTNIEPDHIGPNEHASFEEYLNCKAMLFQQCRIGIINGDDEHAETIIQQADCQIETYGLSEHMDLRASDIQLLHEPGKIGTSYHVSGLLDTDVRLCMPGKFSVYNSLCAIAVTRHFKVSMDALQRALYEVKVKGRIELVKVSDQFTLMIDYAHNAMALESLLLTLREYHPHRLVTVFGCGGNRAKSRRFEMGEVSGRLSDLSIITSDNPRYEEPQAILDDIITGISRTTGKHIDIIDRKEAIKYAIANGEPGDIIILAGKGHEDYQEICGVKHPMDERVLIREVLAELKEEQ